MFAFAPLQAIYVFYSNDDTLVLGLKLLLPSKKCHECSYIVFALCALFFLASDAIESRNYRQEGSTGTCL